MDLQPLSHLNGELWDIVFIVGRDPEVGRPGLGRGKALLHQTANRVHFPCQADLTCKGVEPRDWSFCQNARHHQKKSNTGRRTIFGYRPFWKVDMEIGLSERLRRNLERLCLFSQKRTGNMNALPHHFTQHSRLLHRPFPRESETLNPKNFSTD